MNRLNVYMWVFALTVSACGDDGDAPDVGPSLPDATIDAEPADDARSAADGGVDAPLHDSSTDSSTDTSTDTLDGSGDPCHTYTDLTALPAELDDGYCDGNFAVVCSTETMTWQRRRCDDGTTCRVFPIYVSENIGGDLPPRQIAELEGADCVPEEAETCNITLDLVGGLRFDFDASCTDDLQRECLAPRVEMPLVTPIGGGRAHPSIGYIHDTPCAAGESCVGRRCFADDRVVCNSSTFASSCSGDNLHTCLSGTPFDYEGDIDCASSGTHCSETCDGHARCTEAGEESCDPETFIPTCSENRTTTCETGCYTRSVECHPRFFEGGVRDTRCGTEYHVYDGRPEEGYGTCVSVDATLCNPSTFIERCSDDAAVFCDGTVRRAACPSGMTCSVVDGNAACALPDVCTPGVSHCRDGAVVTCCETDSEWTSAGYWCQPGFEHVLQDCTTFGATCDSGFCI